MKLGYWFIKKWITPIRRHIRLKLSLMVILVAIVPLTVATVISNQSASFAMEQAVINNNLSTIAWASQDYKDNFYRINEALTAFYFDDNTNFYINRINQGGSLRDAGITFFRNKLKNYLLANYSEFDLVSFSIYGSLVAFEVSAENDFRLLRLESNAFEVEPLLLAESVFLYTEEGVYLTKPYLRFEDRKLIGTLVVRLRWRFFDKVEMLLGHETDSFVLFIDDQGKDIYNPSEQKLDDVWIKQLTNKPLGGLETPRYIQTDTHYLFYEQMHPKIWLVKGVPKSVARDFYHEQLISQLLLIGLAGLVAVLATFFLGHYFSAPILSLTQSMQNLDFSKNHFVVPKAIVKSKDEIKVLEQSYLFMIKRINELIDEEYRQKIETQSAQLLALQAQVNPHFMYNTLNMIGSMAVEKESKEIYDVIMAFSRMMRYTMKYQDDLVRVQDEWAHVQQYLHIQKLRFEGKLQVEAIIEPSTLGCAIPKLCLQPIVENCFKHGFIKNSSLWQITIDINREGDFIRICIKDNGKGMGRQALDRLNRNLSDAKDTVIPRGDHVGLANIHNRLKLRFGNQASISVESSPKKGTTVTLRFNCQEEVAMRHD